VPYSVSSADTMSIHMPTERTPSDSANALATCQSVPASTTKAARQTAGMPWRSTRGSSRTSRQAQAASGSRNRCMVRGTCGVGMSIINAVMTSSVKITATNRCEAWRSRPRRTSRMSSADRATAHTSSETISQFSCSPNQMPQPRPSTAAVPLPCTSMRRTRRTCMSCAEARGCGAAVTVVGRGRHRRGDIARAHTGVSAPPPRDEAARRRESWTNAQGAQRPAPLSRRRARPARDGAAASTPWTRSAARASPT